MNDWDNDLGEKFRVTFAFTSSNKDLFYADTTHYKFEVIDKSDLDPPKITVDDDSVTATRWTFSGVTAKPSDPGQVCYLILPATVGYPADGPTLFGWTSNEEATPWNSSASSLRLLQN